MRALTYIINLLLKLQNNKQNNDKKVKASGKKNDKTTNKTSLQVVTLRQLLGKES